MILIIISDQPSLTVEIKAYPRSKLISKPNNNLFLPRVYN